MKNYREFINESESTKLEFNNFVYIKNISTGMIHLFSISDLNEDAISFIESGSIGRIKQHMWVIQDYFDPEGNIGIDWICDYDDLLQEKFPDVLIYGAEMETMDDDFDFDDLKMYFKKGHSKYGNDEVRLVGHQKISVFNVLKNI